MGPTSSPISSTVTLISNPSPLALTSLASTIPTTVLPDLQPSHLLRSLSAVDIAHFFTSLTLTFKAEKFTISDDRARGRDGDGESNEGEEKGDDEEMDDRAIDLQFLINGLELRRQDMATLFFLLKV
ncbi:hypothetical protein ACFX1Z_010257 [Malus domestica]